jgi:hypothetical protein
VESNGSTIEFSPALAKAHIRDEWVVAPGTGLGLETPLKFNHAANLPFSNRGTGITFEPATRFDHSSNEPVQALGTGITLDRPLTKDHEIHAVMQDAAVKTAGYQGTPSPNQLFGGPELVTSSPQFGRTITVKEGSMVLRDSAGQVADSINYGGLVDPWAAAGYQATSGSGQVGCFVPAPGPTLAGFRAPAPAATNSSAGRFPDGVDTASNCNDFKTQAVTTLPVAAKSGDATLKVPSIAGFNSGQTIMIDSGINQETAVIAKVGTAGYTTLRSEISQGTSAILVASVFGFVEGQAISIDQGENAEEGVINSITRFPIPTITVKAPLAHAHAVRAQISGTGLALTKPLTLAHAIGAQVTDSFPTPGAPNRYRGTH